MKNLTILCGILFCCCSVLSAQKSNTFSPGFFDKHMVSLNDSFLVCRYEVTNLQYSFFINDLAISGKPVDQYRVDSAGWIMPGAYNQPFAQQYHRHQVYHNFPVVNITFESATAYCEWLTGKYNQWKERKYKKVVFVLPGEDEWMMAACEDSNDKFSRYPVSGSCRSLLSDKGEYLANFTNVNPDCIVNDSGTGLPVYRCNDEDAYAYWYLDQDSRNKKRKSLYTSETGVYPPTSKGIYDLAGNAAEMLNNGKTKGGSWNSYPAYLQIKAPEDAISNALPNPYAGFRVYMKVIEK